VTRIERWPDLAEQARRNLAGQQIDNVQVVVGDGAEGVPERESYDAVLVSAPRATANPPRSAHHRLIGSGCPSAYPVGLCTPTIAFSYSSASVGPRHSSRRCASPPRWRG
jgi:hypothetical protein